MSYPFGSLTKILSSDEVELVEPAEEDGKRLTRINNESLTDDIGGVDACQVHFIHGQN